LQKAILDYRKRIQEVGEKMTPDSKLVTLLNADLVQSYVENEKFFQDQIQFLKNAESKPTSGELRKELALFMNETQMRLEREKYSLLAKCSALEEEIL
jgi:hypothetical protein